VRDGKARAWVGVRGQSGGEGKVEGGDKQHEGWCEGESENEAEKREELTV